jgi:hypothetical protein
MERQTYLINYKINQSCLAYNSKVQYYHLRMATSLSVDAISALIQTSEFGTQTSDMVHDL